MAKAPPPPLGFLFTDPAHLIACGFGSGLSRFAPGTAGTAFAWACYPLLHPLFTTDLLFLAALAVMFVLGVIVCDITGRHLGVSDHGSIVWDEIVPFWLVLMFTPAGLAWQLMAFLIFRFFDIVKPPPARWFDTQVKNGFGVMMDDLVAAGYTLLALAALKNIADHLL